MSDTFNEAFDLVTHLERAASKEEVLDIMRGHTFGAFIEIDERPGQFTSRPYEGEWFGRRGEQRGEDMRWIRELWAEWLTLARP